MSKKVERVEFTRWAEKYRIETDVQILRITKYEKGQDGEVFAVQVQTRNDGKIMFMPCDIAEVCNYIPRGFRAGHTATFDKNGDLLIV